MLILVAAMASVATSGRLPARVILRFDDLLPFSMASPPAPVPRWLVLGVMPALALVLWVAFRLAPTEAGRRVGRRMFRHAPEDVTSPGQFERFGSTYEAIVLGVVALILGLHAAMLAAALEAPALAARIVPGLLGASMVLMGNVMPRLRPNWVAGLRTRRLLADPQLWRSTHRVFGTAFVAGGMVTVATAVVAPRFGLIVGLGALLASCLVGVVASRRPSGPATLVTVGLLSVLARGLAAQTPPAPAGAPVPPATVAESAYAFERGGLTIHGTLAVPRPVAGKVPVVVIVAGSGPTDRNANGPVLNTNAYALLAWGLAEHGIATLRYDKRGIGQSAGDGGDPTTLSTDDYVADVQAAALVLASDARFSRVILLGHSEGAGHVLQAANRGAPTHGVVMVAAQGRRFTEVIHEQFARGTDSATTARVDTALARFLRGEEPGEVPPVAKPLLVPAYANFVRSLAAYDPPGEARRFAGPLLIVQGTTDVQTTMQDAELLLAAQPRAMLVRLEGVNHVLKLVESTDPQAQVKTYRDPSLPLAPSVVPAIARWIAAGGR